MGVTAYSIELYLYSISLYFQQKLNKIDKNHVATVGDSSGMWKGTQGLSEEDKLKARSYYSNQKEVRIHIFIDFILTPKGRNKIHFPGYFLNKTILSLFSASR